MDEQINISSDDRIFSIGVFLQPVKCTINNIDQWRWVAVGFEDESYFIGKAIDPIEFADNLEGMVAG